MNQRNFDQDFEEFRLDYIQELRDTLDDIEGMIGEYEGDRDPEKLKEINRVLHSAKGSSGSFEFRLLSNMFHMMEDYIEHNFQKHIEIGEKNYLWSYIDLVREYINGFLHGTLVEESLNEELKKINYLASPMGYKALVIESSKSINTVLKEVLKNLGFKGTFYTDGYKALGRIMEEDFDIIVTSKTLVGLNGDVVARIANEDLHKKIPTILLSSNVGHKTPPYQYHLVKDINIRKNLEDLLRRVTQEQETQSNESEVISPSINKIKLTKLEKICYIDDDLDFHKLANMGLKGSGIELSTHSDSLSSLDFIKKNKPDLILLDSVMPHKSGEEVIIELKNNPSTKNIPVIFMTAKSRGNEIEALLSLGAVGIINKPFRPKKLVEEIKKIVM
ncbi:MAG: response regulator [Halobacteriovoraceae bacterium]|nr:response regulator [Halobacteriovoraceae bacterium]